MVFVIAFGQLFQPVIYFIIYQNVLLGREGIVKMNDLYVSTFAYVAVLGKGFENTI